MRCTNNKKTVCILIFAAILTALCGCGSNELPLNFESTYTLSTTALEDRIDGFSQQIAVTDGDVAGVTDFIPEENEAVGLFDVNKKEVLYAKNIFDQKNPASLTKILTVICALKYGNEADLIICSDNVNKLESGASTCGLMPGDQLTLGTAIRLMLLPSANDAAIAVAEHISGSVESFADLMNQEAALLGATNSHFVNPHGLTADDHYTSAYDMYLITNAAIKYDVFNEIITLQSYVGNVTDRNGTLRTVEVKSSNKFMDGTYYAPEGITVIGGKTGTTMAAGSCLALVTNDSLGNPYISIILKATDRGVLYDDMMKLLQEINER